MADRQTMGSDLEAAFPREPRTVRAVNPSGREADLIVAAPYWNLYFTNCKERWRNRSLLDVFLQEFSWRSEDYFREAMRRGAKYEGAAALREQRSGVQTAASDPSPKSVCSNARPESRSHSDFFEAFILVNGKACSPDQLLSNGDVVVHNSLVVEEIQLAVPALPVPVVFEDERILCVNKPPGIPVHPQGLYRQQALLNRLKKFHFADENVYLHPVNRLDRVTSGIVVFAKTPAAARFFTEALAEAGKVYLCQVHGHFNDVFEALAEASRSVATPNFEKAVLCKEKGTEASSAEREVPFVAANEDEEHRISARVAEAGTEPSGVSSAAESLRLERKRRREQRRQQKILRLGHKAKLAEEKVRSKRLYGKEAEAFREKTLDFGKALASGNLLPLVCRPSSLEVSVDALAAAAAAKAEEERDSVDSTAERPSLLSRLSRGLIPLLSLRAKLRTVQAAPASSSEESSSASKTSLKGGPPQQGAEGEERNRNANLLRVVWDEIQGREAETVFCQLAYDARMKQSLVVAVPVSGRSHQIRKHLQLLRHPIVGDLLYGGRPFDEETEKLALKTKAANELFLNKGAAVSPLAVQPTPFFVRLPVSALRDLLPAREGGSGDLSQKQEESCEGQASCNRLCKVLCAAGAEASTVSEERDTPEIQIRYFVEQPSAICLFAAFYAFDLARGEEESESGKGSLGQGEKTVTDRAEGRGQRALRFNALAHAPRWAKAALSEDSLSELQNAVGFLAALRRRLPPLLSSSQLSEEGLC